MALIFAEKQASFCVVGSALETVHKALRDAVESLGGDAGEERTFYGDPDYEALRNLQE